MFKQYAPEPETLGFVQRTLLVRPGVPDNPKQ